MILSSLIERVEEIARPVAAFQLEHFRVQPVGSGTEKMAKEYVSKVDIESEEMLKERLTRLLPDAGFYGEETGRSTDERLLWVVDPLDGTTNYLSGLDEWSVSIALTDGTNPVLGYVLKPFTAESFAATVGGGAWYRDITGDAQRVETADHLEIREAVIGTGFPYRSPHTRKAFFQTAERVLDAARGIRRSGSAALDLCRLAAGFMQGFWEIDLEPYDLAAALVLLGETGCRFSEFSGSEYRLFRSHSIVAGRPGVWEALSAVTAETYRSHSQ